MRARRAFFVEMIVLAAIVVGVFIANKTVHESWRASHVGAYAYLAVYAVAITQLTFYLVLTTGDGDDA
jgi:hypothetical protein